MRLGAHCVLYGPQIKTDTEGVLGKLFFAGAEGCELGERFFGLDERDRLADALRAKGLRLAGLHCNNLRLPDLLCAPDKAREALRKTAAFVSAFEDKNVIASGAPGGGPDGMKDRAIRDGAPDPALHNPSNAVRIAENLNAIAREIREDYGVTVHYHNHSWEFADGGLLWSTLAERAPAVCFALDTGWAAVSGYDPVSLLEKYPGRFRYVHLRDYHRAADPGSLRFSAVHEGFADLGSGDMGYPRLMRALDRALGRDGWAVVEYETGNFDGNSYLRAISYLKGVRDML